MRVVVAGANGLVGARVASLLAARGHDVLGLGRGPRRAVGAWTYASCDVASELELREALTPHRPELVLNAAAMTEVDACEKDRRQAFAANVLAPAHLARIAQEHGAHLVHVSTDYVFDGNDGPYDEEALPNPHGVYATTKHMGEQTVRTLAPSWTIARTAVVYGWPAAGRANFGSWLVGSLVEGKEVKLFEDQFVSPSHADNVAAMVVELGERKLAGVWNVAGADTVNRMQYARALCEVFSFNLKLLVPTRLAELKLASPRPLRSGLKPEKTTAALSAKPLELGPSLQCFHQEYQASVAVTRST